MGTAQEIKEHAHQLGFDLVGITTTDPLLHTDAFEFWLDQGRHGEMGYLNSPRSRTCRGRPDLLLPGCRSVLALGMRYPAPHTEHNGENMLHGRISSYAWGQDYHQVFADRLIQVIAFIESRVGHPVANRWYTDTGPLLEREIAQRAGLGWIGKNTCLINPYQGSYFFLAEVLLGIELEADQPFAFDRCGSCTRCRDACPTGCILTDRTIDARHCISYLTIELKGAIPMELRPLLEDWVFGCDVCQSVCPWNRFARREGDPVFEPRSTSPAPSLLDELQLSEDDFSAKYRHSPLKRARRAGYLRNIVVALGNSHDQSAVAPLEQLMMLGPDPLVRAHTAWALGQIGGNLAVQALINAGKIETDPAVSAEIHIALEHSGYG